MRLAALCEHGKVGEHTTDVDERKPCPGGRLLPDPQEIWWCEDEGDTRKGGRCVLFVGDKIGMGRHEKCGLRLLVDPEAKP